MTRSLPLLLLLLRGTHHSLRGALNRRLHALLVEIFLVEILRVRIDGGQRGAHQKQHGVCVAGAVVRGEREGRDGTGRIIWGPKDEVRRMGRIAVAKLDGT